MNRITSALIISFLSVSLLISIACILILVNKSKDSSVQLSPCVCKCSSPEDTKSLQSANLDHQQAPSSSDNTSNSEQIPPIVITEKANSQEVGLVNTNAVTDVSQVQSSNLTPASVDKQSAPIVSSGVSANGALVIKQDAKVGNEKASINSGAPVVNNKTDLSAKK